MNKGVNDDDEGAEERESALVLYSELDRVTRVWS